ncbi:hemolysin TlyA family protein [Brucella abortus F6/05-3]|uniref:TlyA family RNA methyltransferase n=1 Tax=Brucella abortus TaxID=235 RepID=UPI0001B4A544|nr:TlyA family RNA methyltransferase [Brucella abortus]AIJ55547.1 hemolysin TlyA family protein [Brucella abortus]AIJ77377.1 hemolysin TlyA family protein [Brucella abortus]EEX81929.1 hemolysin A [Brucella abortus bv. 3 str. Tulya]ENS29520.1 hemolysin TlyA family protein [Brucella abortus F6/05-3]
MNGQSTDNRPRLDQLLVERGFFATRSRARDAIQRGTVKVDGRPITKPGQMVVRDAALAVDDPASAYVSRAALKLVAALDHFDLNVKGRTALDIGASTGGFTQVLLERGAHHVIAIDVGHDQLHESLRHDPRVTSKEGVNARALELAHLDTCAVDCIVSDVSFISLRLALPPALALAEKGAICALLVKPQFEAGREAIGKGGILRDPAYGERMAQELKSWLETQPGWRALGLCPSPIEGGDGNREYLLAGKKDR